MLKNRVSLTSTCEFLYKENNNKEYSENFGILNIELSELNVLYEKIEWIFTIDKSGSMADKCKDKKTKMEQIHYTLTNMIKYLNTLNLDQDITIIGFDHESEIICNRKINDELVENLEPILEKLKPRGMTNIENALSKVEEIISNKTDIGASTKICHIFMTDGEITKGSKNINKLSEYISRDITNTKNITNTFIGYGSDHSIDLLKRLSEINGEYYFIESFENSGMIYGEILYNEIYECMKNLEIRIENGEIFDYSSNKWDNKIKIKKMISGKTRTFHVRHKNNMESKHFKIRGKYYTLSEYKKLIDQEFIVPGQKYSTEDINKKVEKYLWRHKTQKIMNNVLTNKKKKGITQEDLQPPKLKRCEHINYNNLELEEFMKNLKKYMSENNLENDEFMKNLCDDIYVAIKSQSAIKGEMFLATRIESQGSERVYNLNNIDEIVEDTSDNLEHTMSENLTSPYENDTALSIMRCVSSTLQK